MRRTFPGQWLLLLLSLGTLSAWSAPRVEVLHHNLTPLIEQAAQDPSRFAVDLAHRVSSATQGQWSIDGGVATWQYSFRVPGAVSVGFHALAHLPPSAVLRLTASGVTYTVRAREVARTDYWSRLGQGDTYQLRLSVDRRELAQVLLQIRSVQAGYRGLAPGQADHPVYRRLQAVRHAAAAAATCVENYACDATASNQGPGLASLAVVVANQWACSGTLLNDVPQDSKPYVLTARHCENGSDGGGDPAAASSVTVYWDATVACGQAAQSIFALSVPVQSGASTVVEQQDAWLILLDQPPLASDAYFAGWDASGAALSGGYTIHEANALSKQYVTWAGTAVKRTIPGSTFNIGYSGTYWEVVNGLGSIDHGASGSALFNPAGSVIGVASRAVPVQCPASPPPVPSDTSAVALFDVLAAVWNSTADTTSTTGSATIAAALDPAHTGSLSQPGIAGIAPTAGLSTSAPSAQTGSTVTLNYYANYSQQCIASGGTAGDGWAGTLPGIVPGMSQGSVNVTESAAGTYTYVMTCSGGARTVTATATMSWTVAPPALSFYPSYGQIAVGVTDTLQWTSNQASCTGSGGVAGDGWAGATLPGSGTFNILETLPGTVSYTLSCGSGAQLVSQTTSVSYVAPQATLQVIGAVVPVLRIGQPLLLQWGGSGGCVGSGGEPGDGWAGAKATSFGYATVTATTGGSHVYTLTCGSVASSASASVTQDFTTGPPVATLTAPQATQTVNLAPPTVLPDNLSWTANVGPCAIDQAGPVSGNLLSGWSPVGSWNQSEQIAGSYTYTLTCGSGANQATATAAIQWLQPAPQVALSVPGPELILGGNILRWTSNVLPCVGSGGTTGDGWNGTLPYANNGYAGYALVTEPASGTYTYTLTCGVGPVGSAQATVVLNNPGGSTLSFGAATNQGYTGQSVPLTWNSAVGPCTAYGAQGGSGWSGALANAGTAQFVTQTPGQYTLQIVCGSGAQAVEAQADVFINAVSAVGASLSAAAEALTGQHTTLTWSSLTAASCTAGGGHPGDGWTGTLPPSGSLAVSETVAGITSYSLTCSNGPYSGSAMAQVNWSPPPTVTLSATTAGSSPLTQALGVPFTLSWTSTSVTGCSASSTPSGLWSGSQLAAGSTSVTVTSGSSATFTLQCQGVYLGTAQADVTLSFVTGPSVVLTPSATQTSAGQPFTLAWTSQAASACTATGGSSGDGWAGAKPVSSTGVTITEAVPGTYEYDLQCTGGGFSASTSVSVAVAAPLAPPAKGSGGGGALDVATLAGLAALARWRRRAI